MTELPQAAHAREAVFTAGDFYEAGRRRLRLTLVAGERNLAHTVDEPVLNRPGLALTGFWEHFAKTRLQLIGHSEAAYLDSLGPAARLERMRALCEHGAFAFIYTNGEPPPADVAALLEELGASLFATPLETSVFARESAYVLARLAAPKVQLYGTMIEVGGLGVMIEGDPGLGKSETALGLVKRGCALVADDLTCIRKDFGTELLFASASEATAGFMEIRGIGLVDIRRVFGVNAVRGEKRLQLVITFRRMEDLGGDFDRLCETRQTKTILGVKVPNVVIPVSEGRDLVNLVETAVQQQRLLASGYDPVKALSDRLRDRADARAGNLTEQGEKWKKEN